MSSPLPDLLDPNEFARFKAKDEAWFLGVAGDTIRDYCGWHISPQVSMTNVQAEIGNRGIVMLQTLNVVSVEDVRWEGMSLTQDVDYVVHDSGWIELAGYYLAGTGGYVVPSGNWAPLRQCQTRWVEVDYTHGYDVMPRAVSEVGFELAGKTMEKPAGVVSDLTSGPYRFKFHEFGSVLSEGQCHRLAPYCITRV